MTDVGSETKADARTRIVTVAARLLREQGPAAVTTRGVAEAAGMQAPAIYRLFGDKDGLLEAVAEHVMATYVAAKAATVEAATADEVDPLDDLRAGWRTQIDFGVANPTLFRLLSDPDRVRHSPAARSGLRVLEARVRRVAATGRLRVSEKRAVGLVHAAGVGAIQILLATPPEDRDPELADALYDAVLRHILTDDRTDGRTDGRTDTVSRDDDRSAATIAFRAIAPDLDALSDAERHLLVEWLDRAIDTR